MAHNDPDLCWEMESRFGRARIYRFVNGGDVIRNVAKRFAGKGSIS